MKYTIHIRRGKLVIDDPQRRCYNGCYFASHMEWSDWEQWFQNDFYPTREAAEYTAKLFERDDQQFKVVEIAE